MSGRIVELAGPVSGARDDDLALGDHGADRHLAARGGSASLGERQTHEIRPFHASLTLILSSQRPT